jgi:hypothetical protein
VSEEGAGIFMNLETAAAAGQTGRPASRRENADRGFDGSGFRKTAMRCIVLICLYAASFALISTGLKAAAQKDGSATINFEYRVF